MFSQILVGTRKNFVIDLADFGTQTEKGCPPLPYIVILQPSVSRVKSLGDLLSSWLQLI